MAGIHVQDENCIDYLFSLTIGPSKNFLSHIGTHCVSFYMAYAILELVPTWLRVLTWSGTNIFKLFNSAKLDYDQMKREIVIRN